MTLDPTIRDRLSLPAVCAPMYTVTGPELVREACAAGVLGVLPRSNADSDETFANWLSGVNRDLALRDQPTRLHIFDRSIELINPRRTAGFSPVAQKAIRYGVPQRLNPQLAAIFSSPAFGGKTPRGGLPMLLRESRLFSNRRTETIAINDEFRIRLHGA